ncbi:hypothetical protein KSP39_PZI019206 [Platanthera zijinensis]|uniref:Cytochrome b561 domain-containing protein n=1 Tax=Platanthera zijinensis TaxID=2320716 RepID=A0AAP0B1G6_9ASPA
MQSFGRVIIGIICLLATSAQSTPVPRESEKLSPELIFQAKLHGFLLWASVGFLMPVGILIIRISNRVQCSKKLRILFYSHVILQMSAVLLATVAAVLSIKKFENSFSNTHQKVGLGLYGLILAQPFIGFLRPLRGVKSRSMWYAVHWLLGTAICITGMMNIYLGLHGYYKMTSKSLRIWTTLLTVQVVLMAFIYLLQDRWDHIKKQGMILREEQISPGDIQITDSPGRSSDHKGFPSIL